MIDTDASTYQPLILVVDDNAMNRELLIRRLEKRGFTTVMATGGLDALEKIRALAVDLVLLDIDMPDLDGVRVLEKVREDRDQTDLPIIMVSAHDESEGIADILNKGANDYLTKPVDFPVAMARIRTQLDVKRAHAQLKESEERYALAFRGANDGLWDWDLRTGRIFYSERWLEMLGANMDAMGHAPEAWFNLVHPSEVEGLKTAIEEHLLGQSETLMHEYRAQHADGTFRWLLARGVASRGKDGQAVRISGSQTDVTRAKAYDPITAIPNKVLFMDRLEWLLDRDKRYPLCYAVFLIKIDRLGELRQTLGAVAVEDILLQTAKNLIEGLRDEDTITQTQDTESITISRHDEADFAILVEGCRDEAALPKLAERIQDMVRIPQNIAQQTMIMTASIGVVSSGGKQDDLSADTIMQHAANAMERARAKGPGHYELFDRDMQHRALARLKLETDLRHAIATGGLHLNFQPIVDIATGNVTGCEALARWNHPERGLVSPVEFIPLAEDTGLIDAIGNWVLEEACRQHKSWPNNETIDMSVNLSLKQMRHDDVQQRILSILERTDMDPKRFKIEITESIFMEDMGRIGTILSDLNRHGIDIAIDDFGTGYSSLAYLSRLPITHLKIDRSFIQDISTDIAAQAIVQSTLLLAQSLGVKVVAEGIETDDQVALLKVFRAEFGQGYFFHKPMSGDDFAKLIS